MRSVNARTAQVLTHDWSCFYNEGPNYNIMSNCLYLFFMIPVRNIEVHARVILAYREVNCPCTCRVDLRAPVLKLLKLICVSRR